MPRHYEDTETRRRQVAEAALRTIAEDGLARFTVAMKPVGVFDLCLVNLHSFLDSGDNTGNWLREQMQLARFAQFCDVYRADIPLFAQRVGLFLITPTLRALGFERWLPSSDERG